MKIARVFPRKTNASPDDALAFFGPPGLFPPEVDEVHISVTFTWDLPRAEWLEKQWRKIAPVKIGGPATGMRGEDFMPGRYVKNGYVITSRGCPNKCWFCSVWKRDGNIRELTITEGWNVLDDNLLACSSIHIDSVFDMLGQQDHRAEFTGGLEARLLEAWHVDKLWSLRPYQFFFAYDTPDDWTHLIRAAELLNTRDFQINQKRCYVLIGYPKDTMENAELRLLQCAKIGFLPMAMLWRNQNGDMDKSWRRFQRLWARPAVTKQLIKNISR